MEFLAHFFARHFNSRNLTAQNNLLLEGLARPVFILKPLEARRKKTFSDASA